MDDPFENIDLTGPESPIPVETLVIDESDTEPVETPLERRLSPFGVGFEQPTSSARTSGGRSMPGASQQMPALGDTQNYNRRSDGEGGKAAQREQHGGQSSPSGRAPRPHFGVGSNSAAASSQMKSQGEPQPQPQTYSNITPKPFGFFDSQRDQRRPTATATATATATTATTSTETRPTEATSMQGKTPTLAEVRQKLAQVAKSNLDLNNKASSSGVASSCMGAKPREDIQQIAVITNCQAGGGGVGGDLAHHARVNSSAVPSHGSLPSAYMPQLTSVRPTYQAKPTATATTTTTTTSVHQVPRLATEMPYCSFNRTQVVEELRTMVVIEEDLSDAGVVGEKRSHSAPASVDVDVCASTNANFKKPTTMRTPLEATKVESVEMIELKNKPLVNKTDLMAMNSRVYEDAHVDAKDAADEKGGARPNSLAKRFERTQDKCCISTHNILTGKRRTRTVGQLNETNLLKQIFSRRKCASTERTENGEKPTQPIDEKPADVAVGVRKGAKPGPKKKTTPIAVAATSSSASSKDQRENDSTANKDEEIIDDDADADVSLCLNAAAPSSSSECKPLINVLRQVLSPNKLKEVMSLLKKSESKENEAMPQQNEAEKAQQNTNESPATSKAATRSTSVESPLASDKATNAESEQRSRKPKKYTQRKNEVEQLNEDIRNADIDVIVNRQRSCTLNGQTRDVRASQNADGDSKDKDVDDDEKALMPSTLAAPKARKRRRACGRSRRLTSRKQKSAPRGGGGGGRKSAQTAASRNTAKRGGGRAGMGSRSLASNAEAQAELSTSTRNRKSANNNSSATLPATGGAKPKEPSMLRALKRRSTEAVETAFVAINSGASTSAAAAAAGSKRTKQMPAER